jgi:ATP-binding cassette, subfamily B, bacterial
MMLFKAIAAYMRKSPVLFLLIASGVLFELVSHYLSALSYKYLIDFALIPRDASLLAVVVGALLTIGFMSLVTGVPQITSKRNLAATWCSTTG